MRVRLAREELKAIREGAMRGSEIVRQLLIYAGKEDAVVGLVDLSSTAAEMLSLIKVSVTKHAVIRTDLGENLPAIRANAAQLRQIVMNLVTNASDAIGDRDGVIRLTTRRVAVGEKPDANLFRTPASHDYVELEVSDTGCGMSSETQAKIFDPFFTTKSAGRGLGLAVVQGIVRSLGGTIHLTSEPGQGTTFRIFLPCAETAAEASSQMNPGKDKLPAASQCGAILVVEDEGDLRRPIVKMLRKSGFEIFEAGDGSSAIELLHAHGDKIDVILLDMTIPGASSHEVVAEAAIVKPDIKVILTSAYSREMIEGTKGLPQVRAFIRKPFQIADLLMTLRSLDANRRRRGKLSKTDPIRTSNALQPAYAIIGSDRFRFPVASKIAFPIAGAIPTIGVSPAPADGRSFRSSSTLSIFGISEKRGTRYFDSRFVRIFPSAKSMCSNIAPPIPIATAPST